MGRDTVDRRASSGATAVRTAEARTLLAVFLIGTAMAGAWIAVLAHGAAQLGPVARGAFVADYDGRVLNDGLELLIIQSDGQAYATLARDPFMDRAVESFRTEEEAAYRAQRPLFAWLVAALSAGRSGWVPPSMALLSAAGAGLAAAGTGALLASRGRTPWLGLVVLLFPGAGAALSFLGPEPLVLGLLLFGVVAWEHDRRWVAVTLFALAVLGRESALLVPLAVGLSAVWQGQWRRAVPLTTIPVVLAGWFAFLRIGMGAWPWEAGEGRLGPPFIGFSEAVPEMWTEPAQDAGTLLLGALLVTAVIALARRDLLLWIVWAHLGFASIMGKFVWSEVLGFGRVLLPLYAAAFVAAVGARPNRRSPDRRAAA